MSLVRVRRDLRRLERLPEPGARLPARRARRAVAAADRPAVRRAGLRAHVARRRSSCLLVAMARDDRARATGSGAGARSSLAIGWFAGLVLSAAWAHKEVFWWPAFGAARPERAAVRRRGRSWSSRSCSGWRRRGGRGRASGCATRHAAPRASWRSGPAHDRRGRGRVIAFVRHGQTAVNRAAGCRAGSTRR